MITHGRFIFQCIISLAVLTIGATLIFIGDENKFTAGVAMVTSIVGYWLPSPKRPRSKEETMLRVRAREIASNSRTILSQQATLASMTSPNDTIAIMEPSPEPESVSESINFNPINVNDNGLNQV